ncbi:MAG: metal-dependent hydrolase [Chthoniobacteraceae bacterium]
MFIAHLPAGYALWHSLGLSDSPILAARERRPVLAVFLVASVFPDVDLLYFYHFDPRRLQHHYYWTHLPVFWLAVFAVGMFTAALYQQRRLALLVSAFSAGALLHLILDTPFGGIAWLYPFSDKLFALVTTPDPRRPWYFDFFLHWTFLVELALCGWAAWVFHRRHWQKTPPPTPSEPSL